MDTCLNVCDLLAVSADTEAIADSIAQLAEAAGCPLPCRVYLGSYFCAGYFLKLRRTVLAAVLQQCRCVSGVTLVVPVFTQKDLAAGKRAVTALADALGDRLDEITVNDIGMLQTVKALCPQLTVNLGRLFFKDPRDVRLSEALARVTIPAQLTDETFRAWRDDALPAERENGLVELDPVSAQISVPEGFRGRICLHTPYCYRSYGHICKFASLHKPPSKKFRPNAPCNAECLRIHERFSDPNKPEWGTLLKIGRALYFEQPDAVLTDATPQRLIYFPFREWIMLKEGNNKSDENINAVK